MDQRGTNGNARETELREIGCVIVNYNTPEIITRAVNSIKNHVNHVIIVDNSEQNNPAYDECDELDLMNHNVLCIHTNTNLGHGRALNKGIEFLKTDYVICMDSDAVLHDYRVIDEMIKALEGKDVYGAGLVVTTDNSGRNKDTGIDYLHPYFCMFKRSVFNLHSEFIHHGAPFIRTMNEIAGKLKVFNIPNMSDKVWHEHRRTRLVSGSDWQKNWENPLL
jgi:glycosyltransferase involved in cell wall biosynthesis